MNDLTYRTLRQIKISPKQYSIIQKGRYINKNVYNKLKSLRRCQHCNKKIDYPPEIHHLIPISCGGTNLEDNLIAVCRRCHKKLDLEKVNE